MKITIITTEKKLSKSIINQMPMENTDGLSGKCLGILLNCRKGYEAVLLFIGKDNTPYLMNGRIWKDYNFNNRVNIGYRRYIAFNSMNERDVWFAKYKLILSEAKQIYI